jgi:hypothetical protein
MIYKSNLDGQWHKVNPNYVPFGAEQTRIRRELFKKGIFRVDKDKDLYYLFVKDWPIGCWSPGNIERASMFINSAFATFQGLGKIGANYVNRSAQ